MQATPHYVIRRRAAKAGFSMLELVIVIVILGIIAAIAVPRISRGADGAAEAALKQDLTVARKALELYRAEHNGQLPAAMHVAMALIGYSNKAGTTFRPTQTTECYMGPYIGFPLPPLPVGRRKGNLGIADRDMPGVAWIYDPDAGTIHANCDDDEVDQSGVRFNQY